MQVQNLLPYFLTMKEKEGLKPQKVAKSYRRKNVPQDPVPSPLPKTNEAEVFPHTV